MRIEPLEARVYRSGHSQDAHNAYELARRNELWIIGLYKAAWRRSGMYVPHFRPHATFRQLFQREFWFFKQCGGLGAFHPLVVFFFWTVIVPFVLGMCVFSAGGCGVFGGGKNAGGSVDITSHDRRVSVAPNGTVSVADNSAHGKAEQPDNPESPAAVNLVAGSASTGSSQGVDQAIGQLRPLVWCGIGLCVLGVAGFVFKAYIPLIPTSAPIAAVVLGGAFILAPVVADRYAWLVPVAGVVVVLVFLVREGYSHNWFRREVSPEKQNDLASKGQLDAAGALAFLHSGGNKSAAKAVATPGPTN